MDTLYVYSVKDGSGRVHLLGAFASLARFQEYMRSIDHLLPEAARQWRTIHQVPHNPKPGEIDEATLDAIQGGTEDEAT